MFELPTPPEPRQELQIGGQAVIEGVVMRGRERWALAVRKPGGEVFVTVNPTKTLVQRYPYWNKFPVRGIFAFVDSLLIGVKALMISGAVYAETAPAPAEPEAPPRTTANQAELNADTKAMSVSNKLKVDSDTKVISNQSESIPKAAIFVALLFSVAIFLGLFIVLPAVVASSIGRHVTNTVVYNLIEGGIRISIFIGYLALMSVMPDIRRVFQYHGAEHKVVHAYEEGLSLTPENAARFSTAHMRCGTAFILIVLVLSILVFSFLGRPALWLRVLERLAIIPFVAAISYEIIKFAGRHEDSILMKILMSPGLLLQKLTTKEPDEPQLEVAIKALQAAIGMDVPSPVGGEG